MFQSKATFLQPDDSRQVLRILDRYLEDLDNETAPSLAELKTQYPDQASEIAKYVDTLKLLSKAMSRKPECSVPLPSEVGAYVLGNVIGVGGMGIVFRARRKSAMAGVPIADVALKVLRAQGEQRSRRFEQEIELTRSLHHEHIVPVLDAGTAEGIRFYTMPIIDGLSLEELISQLRASRDERTKEKLRPDGTSSDSHPLLQTVRTYGFDSPQYRRFALDLAATAADAVHFAHESGIIHRDIKPSNLLVDRTGKLWVTDFGLAGHVETPSPRLTRAMESVGTFGYMSPEQSVGRVPNRRADVYSLGMTISELLTLEKPFDECRDAVNESNRLPKQIETALNRAMSVAPGNRQSTAAELASELRKPVAKLLPITRRSAVATIALATAGAALWLLQRTRRNSASIASPTATNVVSSLKPVSISDSAGSLDPLDVSQWGSLKSNALSVGDVGFWLSIRDAAGNSVTEVQRNTPFYLACGCHFAEATLFAVTLDVDATPGIEFSNEGRRVHPCYRFHGIPSPAATHARHRDSSATVGVLAQVLKPEEIVRQSPLWVLPCTAPLPGDYRFEFKGAPNNSVLVFKRNEPVDANTLEFRSASVRVR